MVTHSAAERQALSDAMLQAGPGAPTLCEGWTTHDLAAHLVARERRPQHALSQVVPPLRGIGERARRGYLSVPFDTVVAQFRSGPPLLGWSNLPKVDATLNLAEFLVHHEDVRRGTAGWAPRELEAGLERAVWRCAVGAGRFFLRGAGVGVDLEWPQGGKSVRARKGEPRVVLRGEPVELLLFCYGRDAAAQVTLEGDPAAVAALTGTKRGI